MDYSIPFFSIFLPWTHTVSFLDCKSFNSVSYPKSKFLHKEPENYGAFCSFPFHFILGLGKHTCTVPMYFISAELFDDVTRGLSSHSCLDLWVWWFGYNGSIRKHQQHVHFHEMHSRSVASMQSLHNLDFHDLALFMHEQWLWAQIWWMHVQIVSGNASLSRSMVVLLS